MTDEPTTFKHILRELPRKRIALVLVVVILNLSLVVVARGIQIGDRGPWWRGWMILGPDEGTITYFGPHVEFVPPWKWTRDEWRETVLPWK
jgi:hypothetical protein